MVLRELLEQEEQAELLEQAVQLEFRQDKYTTSISQFQVELAHIKTYQLIQPVQLNRQFLKQQLELLQF